MDRKDLQQLLDVRDDPCVSILAPMERSAPGARQNPIRLKNLVRRARSLLDRVFSRRQIPEVHDHLSALELSIEDQPVLEGIGLFASRSVERRLDFPFSVHERVVVDHEFALRDVVHALERTARYRVLVLSDRPSRLLEGTGRSLVEVIGEDFPLVRERPGELAQAPGGVLQPKGIDRQDPRSSSAEGAPHVGFERSTAREKYRRRFVHSVDEGLGRFADSHPLPLLLVGVDRQLAFFEAVSRHAASVVARIEGAHDLTPPHQLAALVWPIMERRLRQQTLARARRALDSAMKSRRVAWGLEPSSRAASEGRGAVLVLEESFGTRVPAGLDHEELVPRATQPERTTGSGEEIVEAVLRSGGEVLFVPDGALADEPARIALTLRYGTGATS